MEPSLSISQAHTYDREDLETLAYTKAQIAVLTRIEFSQLQQSSESRWREYWSHSRFSFHDTELEKIWYHNQYFLACCLRKNKTAPDFSETGPVEISVAPGTATITWITTCQQVYLGVFFE